MNRKEIIDFLKSNKENKRLVLIKTLPGCPIGRIFKEDIEGGFFHSMTDEEAIKGNYKSYQFTKKEVMDNPKFFRAE